jgi:hypothetical protein
MKDKRSTFKTLMRCNTLHNTIEVVYLLRSGPEVRASLWIYICVNTWTPPTPKGAYLISCFLSNWSLCFVCYDPHLRFYVSRVYMCVCVFVCFQYRFIFVILHNGTMLPQYVYVFSYVKLSFCGLGEKLLPLICGRDVPLNAHQPLVQDYDRWGCFI